jgi:hypothetical protein
MRPTITPGKQTVTVSYTVVDRTKTATFQVDVVRR